MTASVPPAAGPDSAESDVAARLSSINAVFGLSLVLTQASSPAQAVRLITTAVPAIVSGHTAVAWHPSTSGDYYQQAPTEVRDSLARAVVADRLDVQGVASCWAFPITPMLGRERLFLVIMGHEDPREEETFLLSVLAQLCGTVIAHHELLAEMALRSQADRDRDAAQARAVELAASEARQREMQRELMASRARLVTASDTARRQVTRDLHDGAQQRLVATLINLQLAEQKWDSSPERARELLRLATRDARAAIEDLREIVAGILPATLTQHGLAAAVGSPATRLPIPVQVDIPARRLPGPVEVSVYFFCSEALTNVVKHARATSARVQVQLTADQCTVEVCDDGIGGAHPRSESSGLVGLRDRIGALNGTMDIISPGDGGTVLRAVVPLTD